MGTQCVRSSKEDLRRENKEKGTLQTNEVERGGQNKQNVRNDHLDIKRQTKLTTIDMNESHLYCMICKQRYNLKDKIPVQLCKESHTICMSCKEMLLATKNVCYKICPYCKRILHEEDITVNLALTEQLQ